MSSRRYDECELNYDNHDTNIWYCVDCDSCLCESCWILYPPHTGNKKGRDGLEHEKTLHHVYSRLKDILNPNHNAAQLEEIHNRDLDTTWFGIRKDGYSRSLFADFDVYSNLTGEPLDDDKEKFPQLASFIGQTNAGKSTLIKMLTQLHEPSENVNDVPTFPSPIVGSTIHTHTPTSADVHLYADPERFGTSKPLLYADCEGFNAGEKLPFGAVENRTSPVDGSTSLSRLTPGRTRILSWADTKTKNTRAYIVKELYPRILYTFSDVVVFVLRDSKTFEATTLLPLLEWGIASLEMSINQPTLPHAIIALNSTEVGVYTDEWDSRRATENLLDANKDCLDRRNGHPFFLDLAEQWETRGRHIGSILDLISCYYSTFKVVRIPYKGRYTLLDAQIRLLHKMIAKACDRSSQTKRSANMLSNSDELNVYLRAAFEHFSNTLDRPFNFMTVSLQNNPIPDDFGGHILQLAIAIQSNGRHNKSAWIFENLSELVASSVMLDCIRHRKGLPEELFVEYEDYCWYALKQFCDRYSPCSFRTEIDRCVNVASKHNPKGHQNARGKIIAVGQFQSNFHPDRYFPTWRELIKEAISWMHRDLQSEFRAKPDRSEEACLLGIHSKNMNLLYDTIGSAEDFLSHTTCFCCLMQAPQHTLPCSHALCSQCVRSYGKRLRSAPSNKHVLSLECCPLHPASTQWPTPCIIRFKPDHAGVRLLCLDGGGMRGIVELEVLRAIRNQLGIQIPIQAFFDLIVGTSTGGIIALALGVKNWSLEHCTYQFKSLCSSAFTPRKGQSVPILKHIIAFKHAAKYETTPLRNALKAAFGSEERLFGNNKKDIRAKVAVTATDGAGKRAIVIANYNRKNKGVGRRRAATSAAPPYFKPFEHAPSKRTYLDGAVYHNNPVLLVHRERKLLWPDVAHKGPDIFLSIGTSQNKAEVRSSLPTNPTLSRTSRRKTAANHEESQKRRNFMFPKMRQMITAMHNRIDSILNAELMWRDFCSDVVDLDGSADDELRHIRINPDIKRNPPSLDKVNELEELRRNTKHALKLPDALYNIERVAHILVASSFYYERIGMPKFEADNTFSCTGQLCCRFEDGSDYLRELGEYFRKQQTGPFFRPYFEIESDRALDAVPISRAEVSDMCDLAQFSVEVPDISARRKDADITISLYLCSPHLKCSKYPISGFPRAIMQDIQIKREYLRWYALLVTSG
ncbi:hypothetical protein P153DRAFT_340903 [Dothidotthia symphoricarpi CBS 119687]|uniref:FabD/lysophospholipase-like protein n=1 Tax=Dothidotthia symphoricarpi CBS 119687 TaxID=1392245 RepID=A0A6A6AC66_9PLEO|nr:uncharacterized protein P153DRAFT_340903 [Dothidotthia symphoricarpi CBS 119687]KAF2128735.1 hypothetical protein P153DRAFT_340903 [Dothidotthia symphoricarpi CBS 119687]